MANWPIVTVAAIVADFSGMERIHHKGKRLEKGKTKDPANDKLEGRGPLAVSHKQMWQDPVSSGTPKRKSRQPSSVSLSL